MHCKWCKVGMREVTVLVGPAPGRPAVLYIDVNPHVDGRVEQQHDGRFRMLDVHQTRDLAPTSPRYRVHGRRSCSPGAARRDPWRAPDPVREG